MKIFSSRKKVIFVLTIFLILPVLLIVAELIYCFNSEICLFKITRSFPYLEKFTNVQKTNFGFRRSGFSLSEETSILGVSGEIQKVENDRLNLIFDDGSQKTFLVKEGTEFIVVGSQVSYTEGGSQNLEFVGDNLDEILSSGNFLTVGKVVDSQICSEYDYGGVHYSNPIVVTMSKDLGGQGEF